MGWSRGSDLMDSIIRSLKYHVINPSIRKEIYKDIIDALEDHDWDTQDECLGIDEAFDAALHEHNRDNLDLDNLDEE